MPELDMREWTNIRNGESGDAVYRRNDATVFAKIAGADRKAALEGERDRLLWLEERGVACPRVIEWRDDEACLLTSAVEGVPASELSGDDLWKAWPSIVEALGTLHRLDTRTCPFDRGLATMLPNARDVVARDAVNPDFLSVADRAFDAKTLLALVETEAPLRLSEEAGHEVVCHGDATMPNVMIDPVGLDCTGFVDLGRMGTADPYVDFSLMLANAGEIWVSENQARNAFDRLFGDLGIDRPDRDRLAFYLRLDPLTWG